MLGARLATLALLLQTVLGVGEESECEMPAKDHHCSMGLTCHDFFRSFSCDQLEAINCNCTGCCIVLEPPHTPPPPPSPPEPPYARL